MLHLQAPTDDRWLRQVDAHLDEVLIDHAHCEKKAAGTALNLIFHYVEDRELCREMTAIVNEELEHFHMVLDLLDRRGIRFRRLKPSQYGRKLNDLVRKQEPQRAVDRLLVAGLIEARSCERFQALAEHVADAGAGRVLPQPVRDRSPAPCHVHPAGDALRARGGSYAAAWRAGTRPKRRSSPKAKPLPRMHS